MSILDDVVVNAKSAVDIMGKKAEKLVDYSKLKYTISSVTSEISKKYEALGRFLYDASICNEHYEDAVIKDKFDEITDLKKQLDIAKQMLAATKNKKTCPICSEENEKDSAFCMKCGNKFELKTKESVPQAEEDIVTPNKSTPESVAEDNISSNDDATTE